MAANQKMYKIGNGSFRISNRRNDVIYDGWWRNEIRCPGTRTICYLFNTSSIPENWQKKVRHVDHYKRVLCLRKESSFMSFWYTLKGLCVGLDRIVFLFVWIALHRFGVELKRFFKLSSRPLLLMVVFRRAFYFDLYNYYFCVYYTVLRLLVHLLCLLSLMKGCI